MNIESAEALSLDARDEISLTQLVALSGLPEAELRELVGYGALAPRDPGASTWTFSASWVIVARTAFRLRKDFELDAHALSVVLSFVERIEVLETELRALRARAGMTR